MGWHQVRSKIPVTVEMDHVVGRVCEPDFRFPANVKYPTFEFFTRGENTNKDLWKRTSSGEILEGEMAQFGDRVRGVYGLN